MDRTGHISVKAYKRSTDKLKELSSSVLNRGGCKKGKVEDNSSTNVCGEEIIEPVNVCASKHEPIPSLPKIDFSNAVNCTVNFTFSNLKEQ